MKGKRQEKMNIGEMHRPCILVKKERAVSLSGSAYDGEETLTNVWAKMTWLKGREAAVEGASTSRVAVVFTIRFIEGIDAYSEIEYKGERYDIQDYREKGRDRFLHLGCVKIT